MRTSEELLSKYSPNAEKCYLFKYKDCRFEKLYVDCRYLEKRFGVSTSNEEGNCPDHTTLVLNMIYRKEMILPKYTFRKRHAGNKEVCLLCKPWDPPHLTFLKAARSPQ